ncbi:NlpC/P60 family protein [Castellaniella defragrans]|jgi:cell wall-associated NlpC family hydrolase|uniref:Cell wall-associated NlpC family hydrolase n=1 Tax=Castellaniella defragrans TaxID=75697 RepID=A0A7W9TQI4_CASDE|nr:C40 family peptidase [Castellaniella defragrans]MBB6085005.1 cell wall-associated NlpC family hydrolase [Castellaniella defragrans]
MPPPHSASDQPNPPRPLAVRSLKLLLCAGLVALAGCAHQPRKTADASLTSNHLLRDSYLLSTQSDPLGAWLDNKRSLAIDTPEAELYGTSQAPKTLAATAMKFLGVKYRYGGDAPGEGFDCSGLVAYAAEKSLGLKLPRRAREQAQQGISVDREELRRGDLVFFNTLGQRYSHVGIYLGDHKFLHAPRTGASIRVDSMDMAYWRKRYNGARRLQAQSDASSLAAVEAAEPAAATPASGGKHANTRHASAKHAAAKPATARRTAARPAAAKSAAAKHTSTRRVAAKR